MIIQLQPHHLSIQELELELIAVEVRVVLMNNTMVIGADNYDIRGVVVLRTGEIGNMCTC